MIPLAVREAIRSFAPDEGTKLVPPTEKETSFIFDWGVRVLNLRNPDAAYSWLCLATDRCRTRRIYYALSSGKTSGATKHLKEAHKLQSGTKKRKREANLELYDQQEPESERSSAKHTLLWDKDGVDGDKSSMAVLLDWIIEGTNYSRWREGDTSTKDALVQGIMSALMAVKIQHRSPAQIWEKIADLENRYRVAENYLAEAKPDVDEDSLRVAVLKYFPHFYLVRAVMSERPPTRQRTSSDTTESAPSTPPRSTSDTSNTTVRSPEESSSPLRSRLNLVFRTNESSRRVADRPASSTPPRSTPANVASTVESAPSTTEDVVSPTTSVVAEEAVRPITEESIPPVTSKTLGESTQTAENHPRVSGSNEKSTRYRRPEPIVEDKSPERHYESQDRRANMNRSTIVVRENEPRLEERQLQMMEAKNDVDVAIKKVQLECVQREANVQLLLARKQLMDSGIPAAEIDLLLPLPTRARSSR
ncbi:hypothetical protein P3T76_008247 [Phytophthora citrophthora]|uniref:Uncharacterized protein n=1 Tax=Phytophthora citrophthora TaxID=4793 RepID=A0AAD9LLY5_9STRA|nr:hypothetical protein P3T76_008247 [Phytophthora citrophthora]